MKKTQDGRILSVEADGTIKIIRDKSISDIAWDTSNANTWARPATLNTYLNNDYYNGLTENAKEQITTGTFKTGPVTNSDTNLGNTVTKENNTTWNGNIALATASEYVRTSNNSQCTSVSTYYSNSNCYSNGSTHNWLTKIMNSSTNKYSWLLSPAGGTSALCSSLLPSVPSTSATLTMLRPAWRPLSI
ncbi:MAG: DUF6273 domain-containing protein [Bacilli bacterium]